MTKLVLLICFFAASLGVLFVQLSENLHNIIVRTSFNYWKQDS
jgi:hypothetical protein